MGKESNSLKTWLIVLIALSLLTSFSFGVAVLNKTNDIEQPEVDTSAFEQSVADLDSKIDTKIGDLENEIKNISKAESDTGNEPVVSVEYDTEYSVKDKKKSIATNLSLEETKDEDFIEDVFDILSADVDNEKDIKKIEAKDFDYDETGVDLSGEDATVTLELNVYYIVDSDEEECGKTRIQVEFEVEDLDRDENYEKADVESYSIVEERVHDVDGRYCIA